MLPCAVWMLKWDEKIYAKSLERSVSQIEMEYENRGNVMCISVYDAWLVVPERSIASGGGDSDVYSTHLDLASAVHGTYNSFALTLIRFCGHRVAKSQERALGLPCRCCCQATCISMERTL